MKRRVNIKYALMQALVQGSNAIYYGFGVYMLMKRGFNSAEAGACLSIACAFNVILTPIISNYIETHDRPTVVETPIIYLIIISSLLVVNFFTSNMLIIAITFIICMGLTSGIDPMLNSISNTFTQSDCKINYTLNRSIGSLSYGFMCTILGILTEFNTYTILLFAGMGLALSATLTFILTRNDYQIIKSELKQTKKEEKISLKVFLSNNKLFLIMCVFIAGLFFGQSGIENFLVIVLESVGGSNADAGKILGFKAVFEAIAITSYPLISKRFKLDHILMFSAFAFTLKAAMVCLSQSIFWIYMSQLMQMFAFAMMLPSMLAFVNKNMSKQETIRGNAFYALACQFGTVTSGIVSGTITNAFGVLTTEYVCLVVSACCALGFILTLKNRNKFETK